ncbi:hypothetical protein ABPG74_014003 [Tetrahymena malaccensis]
MRSIIKTAFKQVSGFNKYQGMPSGLKSYFSTQQKADIKDIPMLDEFMKQQREPIKESDLEETQIPYLNKTQFDSQKKYFIETYGCQMNESDTEIISGIMQKAGFVRETNLDNADIVFLNTCAIREGAENKIWKRLENIRAYKRKEKKQLITGVLGCMAERLKDKLVEKNKVVDIIVGPDAYRDLPRLIQSLDPSTDDYSINVQLSLEETYADVVPVRQNPDSCQAFVSIMRGCNNMCSFCIVPFTRGRERSRDIQSIVDEVKMLANQGVKEITLLGQNVNSYFDKEAEGYEDLDHLNSEGFKETFKLRKGKGARFAHLLEEVAKAAPEVRFRFTSPHPKDFPDPVIQVIKKYPNIAKNLHMPAQSGNTEMLTRMRRNYSRENYINLVDHIKKTIPGITLSSDFICGFCGETDQEFEDTLTLLEYVKYENAFLFAYSLREKTHAHRHYKDDVPEEVKKQRLQQMIDVFHKNQELVNKQEVGRVHLVLVEGKGKFENQIRGRTDTNKRVIFNSLTTCSSDIPEDISHSDEQLKEFLMKQQIEQSINQGEQNKINNGDFILARVDSVSVRSLFCTPIAKCSISQFAKLSKNNPFIQY